MTTAISAFLPGILPDVTGCPPFVINAAVVDAIIQLCKDATLFKKAFEHSVDASADVDTGDNDSITINLADYVTEDLRPWDVLKFEIDGEPYDTSLLELENNVDDITIYQLAKTKFFNFPDIESIKFFPMDTVLDVLIFLELSWLPLKTMTTVDDTIYNNHLESVQSYARWLLMKQPKKTWTDLPLAEYHLSQYSRTMEAEKIQKLMGRTFGTLQPKRMRWF